jgi:hypothetical protein
MQPNDFTLSVDEENDDTGLVDQDYTRHEEYLNRSIYIGENHSLSARDTISFYRTPPKPNGNFKGVGKSAFKLSEDFTVVGVDSETTLTSPAIMEVSFSIPVGLTPAQTLAFRQRGLSLLDDDALVAALIDQLTV